MPDTHIAGTGVLSIPRWFDTTAAGTTTISVASATRSNWWLPDMPDDPEGLAGVREPRRPMPTSPAVCR